MAFSRSALFLIAVVGTGTPLAVKAQALPSRPPTREELQREQATQPPRDTGSRVTVEGDVERAPCPLADPRFASVRMTITGAQFDGLQVISPETLRSTWAEFARQSVPVATVCEIRDRAATILRRQGYVAAVQVPPQRIEENGTVRFDVLMAKLVRIQVRGDTGRAEGTIARQLAKLQDQPVFNTFEAERYLLLVQDMPGYDARLTLRPAGTRPGEVIGEVSVRYTPIEIEGAVQNLGSREVGRFGGLIRARLHGLTGLADTTTLAYYNTFDWSEQHVVQASHAFRLGHEGLTLGGDFTYAWTRPDVGGTGAGADPFRTRTLIATLRASYPLQRSLSQNLWLGGGLDLANQRVTFTNVPISEDKIRVLFARLDYDRIDPKSMGSLRGYSANEPRWRIGGSLEARQGVSILDASKPCPRVPAPLYANCPGLLLSRAEADPTAFVLRASAYAEFRPVPKLTISLAPRAQYAPNPLLAFEEFSTGNYTVGRGYEPGVLTGDSGIGAQAELRLGSLTPRSAQSWAFQPFAFFDAARVWNQDQRAPYPRDPQSLYSAGGGLRARWGDRARLEAYAAAPLKRVAYYADPANQTGLRTVKGDVRLLVSLTVNLFPWTR
ncbi:ShlB/FhaC/HecB family hemolysin secretion/activation protein [Novosphingobium sp. JCM 18896]|uniref:ShlB/FhaC/HecB family hemolysin secretion/activation protein n=1 Tax=Novosphingobium sp. JCM 18896 TaxID=2989731 RepID=UPI0022215EB2|nr:ShlB/FhaC/HecB family hemolysin secretion/activation protein [Novosphingobium sp. JCM 18896]MCW1428130.1 BamA/TamA family outer membrane protein [Novosphingobium sp. JCM 18896]